MLYSSKEFSFSNQGEVIRTLDLVIDSHVLDSVLAAQLKDKIRKELIRTKQQIGRSVINSLQGSIEQSLVESDKVRQMTGKSTEEVKESVMSLKGRYGNCEELLTGRTISFGIPEMEAEFEENLSVNFIIEEYKKKLEQQKNEELNMKSKELEKAFEDKERTYQDTIESMRRSGITNIEEIVALKEQEIEARLNIRNMQIINEKKSELTRQYMENREKLAKEFEDLKQKLYKEVEEKTQMLEEEHKALIKELNGQNESHKEELERTYKEKEDIANNIKEKIEEYKMKIENLQKEESIKAIKKAEYKTKIEELELKLKLQKEDMEQYEVNIKKLKEESELKCEQLKKKLEKEYTIKAAQIQRKYKEADEKNSKLRSEYESLQKKVLEEREAAVENAIKKYKEDIKLLKEKHKGEIRNIKDAHKNEFIKKDIEVERERKKLSTTYKEEIELLKKQDICLPKQMEADNEKVLQQKINALKKKLEVEHYEKEKTLRETAKNQQEVIQKLKEQMATEYQLYFYFLNKRKLKQETGRLRKKYKSQIEELRADYGNKVKDELEDSNLHNALFESNSKRSNTKSDVESVRDEEVHKILQSFMKILSLELDKLLKLADGSKDTTHINRTIAKMILTVTKDGSCREYLETFKVKLNSVISTLKHSLEEQYKRQYEKETNRSEDSPFIFLESESEPNILTKITPIMNNKGKYMVDIEKVVSDLLLVKDALYSILQQAGESTTRALEGTSCTILEELTKAKDTIKQNTTNNIAKHYRVLLNTILRFAVEATWVINDGLKNGKKYMGKENEEVLRLKLLNAELNEKLAGVEGKTTLPRSRKYL